MKKSCTITVSEFSDLGSKVKKRLLNEFRDHPLDDVSWTHGVWKELEKELSLAGIKNPKIDTYTNEIPSADEVQFYYSSFSIPKLVKWVGMEIKDLKEFEKMLKKQMKELRFEIEDFLFDFYFYKVDGNSYKLQKEFQKKFRKLVTEKIVQLKHVRKHLMSDQNVQVWVENKNFKFYPNGDIVSDPYILKAINC